MKKKSKKSEEPNSTKAKKNTVQKINTACIVNPELYDKYLAKITPIYPKENK